MHFTASKKEKTLQNTKTHVKRQSVNGQAPQVLLQDAIANKIERSQKTERPVDTVTRSAESERPFSDTSRQRPNFHVPRKRSNPIESNDSTYTRYNDQRTVFAEMDSDLKDETPSCNSHPMATGVCSSSGALPYKHTDSAVYGTAIPLLRSRSQDIVCDQLTS